MSLGSTTPSGLPSDITPLDVARKALELAQADPDHVYNSTDGNCYYAKPGHESCVFGQAFAALGVDIPSDWEQKSISDVLRRIFHPDENYDVRTHGSQYALLDVAQVEQDAERRWGSDDVAGNIERWIGRNS